MKLEKRKKIATEVTKKIAFGLVVVFVILTLIIQFSIRNDLTKREQDKLTLLANQNASITREFMESMSNKQELLSNIISHMDGVADEQRIETLNRIIAETKKEEQNALSLFYIAEPNSFIQNTPNGYAIFATEKDTKSEADMYRYVNKELYEQVKQDKKMTIVDPFVKTIDGIEYQVITVVRPILNEKNEFIGVVGSNIDTNLLNNADYNHGGFASFAMQIICGHKTVITNSKNPESIGKPYLEVSDSTNSQKILDSANSETPLTFVDKSTDGTKYYKSYVPFYLDGSSIVWLSGTSITKAEFDAQIFKQVAFIVAWMIVALIALTFLAYFRIKYSLHPIEKLNEAIKALSQGNLHYDLDLQSDDEFGSLADSLRSSTATLYSYVTDIDRAMEEMANGNFDIGASEPFIGDFKNIETSITKFLTTMSSTLLQIKIASQQVSADSEQVADGAQELAQNATEQSNAVDLLSTEIVEISTQIKNNANSAASVNQLAGVVGKKIQTSNQRMNDMAIAMSNINRSSEEIGEIVQRLEGIVMQTNILALNAAVEAARAGAVGKGFAVVAEEVRKLATKSSEVAKQTSALIEESVNSVKKGVKIAHETEESLVEVVEGAAEITELIAAISHATTVQTGSIEQITLGVAQIASVVQTNSATSEESAAASEELSSQAEMMRSLVSQFQLKSNEGNP